MLSDAVLLILSSTGVISVLRVQSYESFPIYANFFDVKKKIKFEFIQFLYQIRLFTVVIDVISMCDDGQELFSSRIISNVSPGRSLRVPLGTI